jgi:DNA polymerase-4
MTVLHVDMDAFYVAVELRDQPRLRGRPVAVGGRSRGVVLSASYEARARGIQAPMPVTQARRRCPELVMLPPRFERYAAVSAGVMAILRSITPAVQPVSGEEAFLDVRGAGRRLGPPAAVAAHLRDRIADEQGITCSVGIAPTVLVAKMATNACKPDGMLEVRPDEVIAFLHPLPVGALWGVGEQTEARLHALGLTRVGDLARTPTATLVRAFGPALGRRLSAMAWGEDERDVVPGEVAERSVGAQETLAQDVDDPEVLRRELLRLAVRVTARMRAAGVLGRTVVLTVRFADFTTITRSRTLREHTDRARDVHTTAVTLLDALGLERARVRLVGVRVTGVVPAEEAWRQPGLFERTVGWSEAERAVDAAVRRFGRDAVCRASLVPGRWQD